MLNERRLEIAAGTLLALSALLYLHRYIGINHDAVLYLGQALLRRWPHIFGQDMFFASGGQSQYTLLPWLVSKTFACANPGIVFLLGSLLGLLMFCAAAWAFIKTSLPAQQRYWALLGILCLPSFYGMVSMFSYAESFFTPRPLAEAFCLFGLALLARKRWLPALACVAAAGLLHPLQAIAACLVAWPWLVLHDRRWLHAIWLALPIGLLGFTDIRPFVSLFQPIDHVWLLQLRELTGQLFLSEWRAVDFSVLAFDVAILAYAWRALDERMGRWCLSALLGLVLGLGLSWVLVDCLHLQLPAELQLWRVHWLAHCIAMASVGALLYRDAKQGDLPRALCLCLTLLLVQLAQGALWIWPLFGALYMGWSRLFGKSTASIKPLLGALFLAGILGLFALYAVNEWLMFRMAHYRLELYGIDHRLLIHPLLAMGLPAAGAWWWKRSTILVRRFQVALLLALTVVGGMRWDGRPPMALAFENSPFRPDLFGPTLPADAQVMWLGELYPSVWLTLHRAEYFSKRQLSGLVFDHAASLEARKRMQRVLLAVREDLYCQQQPSSVRSSCAPSNTAMRRACHPGPVRRPDFMVMTYHLPFRTTGRWEFIDHATGKPAETFWLYSCEDIMDGLNVPLVRRARVASP